MRIRPLYWEFSTNIGLNCGKVVHKCQKAAEKALKKVHKTAEKYVKIWCKIFVQKPDLWIKQRAKTQLSVRKSSSTQVMQIRLNINSHKACAKFTPIKNELYTFST